MPLYLPSNKPRSLHRQAPSHVHSNSTSLPSNVELSLEQWLQRDDCQLDPYPSASSLPGKPLLAYNKSTSSTTSTNSCSSANSHDDPLSPVSLPVQGHDDDNIDVPALSPPPRHGRLPCPCCKTTHCDTWDRSVTLIRKLEGEIRLAAEIGQNLLQKNETYALEVGQMKDQLHLAYERRHHIEASLDESENMAQRLNREKDKWLWQYEKSEKILQETVADLETTNDKCAALTHELEYTKMELEKLHVLKLKSQQSEARETALQAKVNDLEQELAIARKNELTLESKYKKLVSRYESVSLAYQDLCEGSMRNEAKGSTPLVKVLTSMIPPTAAEIQQASTDELVDLIKELLGTNNGLKKELGETQARLDETRTDLTIAQEKWQALEDQQSPHAHMGLDLMRSNSADSHSGSNRQQIGHSHRPTLDQQVTALASKRPSQASRVRNHAAAATRGRSKSLNKSKSPMRRAPVPKATTSTPAVHHHYHYYVDHAHDDALNAKLDKSPHPSNPPTRDASIASATRVLLSRVTLPPVSIAPVDDESPIRRASFSSPLATHAPFLSEELKMASPSPYASLHEQVHTLMQRLASTDIRLLNRRLQRAFDIVELTQRSNSMLQNIVADIDVLDARFAWLTNDKQQDYRFFTHEFLAMVHLLQDVLKEFGQLSITMNHLQVAYVNKMERLQESQLSAPATPTSAMDTTTTTSSSPSTSPLTPLNPVAWFSTFFVDEHAPQTPSSPSQRNKEWTWPSFTTLIDDLRLTNAKTAAASSTPSTLDAKWTPSFSTKWLGSND